MLSISRKIASKCGLTASPSGESRRGGPRSNKGCPSSCSNRRIAAESYCWEIPQIAAAPVNFPTSHNARKYLICARFIKLRRLLISRDCSASVGCRKRCATPAECSGDFLTPLPSAERTRQLEPPAHSDPWPISYGSQQSRECHFLYNR